MKAREMRVGIVVVTALTCITILLTGLRFPYTHRAESRNSPANAKGTRIEALLPYWKVSTLFEISDLVVEGEVIQRFDSAWNSDRSLVYTDFELIVAETFRGNPEDRVIVRNPGGIDPDTSTYLEIGDAPKLIPGRVYLLFLTTEALPVLDMSSGSAYYVTGWAGGTYEISSANAINQLHEHLSEPANNLRVRLRLMGQGQPDPYPLPGLPIFDSRSQ